MKGGVRHQCVNESLIKGIIIHLSIEISFPFSFNIHSQHNIVQSYVLTHSKHTNSRQVQEFSNIWILHIRVHTSTLYHLVRVILTCAFDLQHTLYPT